MVNERSGGNSLGSSPERRGDFSEAKAQRERQQRKLSAVFITGEAKYLNAPDVKLYPEIDEDINLKFKNKEINDKKAREVISQIKRPESSEEAYGEFLENFPTPFEFETERKKALGEAAVKVERGEMTLEEINEEQRTLNEFAARVYGKQYEYYLSYLDMKGKAAKANVAKELKEVREAREASREREENLSPREASRRHGARVLDVFAQAGEKVKGLREKVSDARERREEERRPVFEVGEVEKSKGMTYEGGSPTACEDGHFVDEKQGVFAVFDGVGGEAGGRKASQTAVEGFKHFSKINEFRETKELATTLEKISEAIARDPEAGMTTATVAKIMTEKGRKVLKFAQVGDSRIYVVRGRDAYQITTDEGYGHRIDNWLGDGGGKVSQTGTFPLMGGDKVVLCTDGVTGDYGDERMSNYEIADIVNRAGHPQVAARVLVEEARKHDDRTAIVVQV